MMMAPRQGANCILGLLILLDFGQLSISLLAYAPISSPPRIRISAPGTTSPSVTPHARLYRSARRCPCRLFSPFPAVLRKWSQADSTERGVRPQGLLVLSGRMADGEDKAAGNGSRGDPGPQDGDPVTQVVSSAESAQDRKEGPTRRLRDLPIFCRKFDKEIISMAIPSYTAVMLDPVATIVDVSFIGRLPDSGLSLAGMGISNSILNYFGFTFFFIVVTTTTTLAQTLAQAALRARRTPDGAISAGELEVEDTSKEAGSRVIAASMLVATGLGVASASFAWSIIPPNLYALSPDPTIRRLKPKTLQSGP